MDGLVKVNWWAREMEKRTSTARKNFFLKLLIRVNNRVIDGEKRIKADGNFKKHLARSATNRVTSWETPVLLQTRSDAGVVIVVLLQAHVNRRVVLVRPDALFATNATIKSTHPNSRHQDCLSRFDVHGSACEGKCFLSYTDRTKSDRTADGAPASPAASRQSPRSSTV